MIQKYYQQTPYNSCIVTFTGKFFIWGQNEEKFSTRAVIENYKENMFYCSRINYLEEFKESTTISEQSIFDHCDLSHGSYRFLFYILEYYYFHIFYKYYSEVRDHSQI